MATDSAFDMQKARETLDANFARRKLCSRETLAHRKQANALKDNFDYLKAIENWPRSQDSFTKDMSVFYTEVGNVMMQEAFHDASR